MMQIETRDQIAALSLDPECPLVIVDADEVLVSFALPFSQYLKARNWDLRLIDYSLEYAIWRDDRVADPVETQALVNGFIDTETHRQPMIHGAQSALQDLSKMAQIVVLSNVPQRRYHDRLTNLAGHGMGHPLIANAGPKGPALRVLGASMRAPVLFIDDSPAQIESASEYAPHIRRVHFSGCEMIRPMMPVVTCADIAPLDWRGVHAFAKATLGA